MNQNDYLLPHLLDLAKKADSQHRVLCSRFLTLDEQEQVASIFSNKAHFGFFGGFEDAERKIAVFAPAELELEPDILCIHLEAKGKKFALKIGHRDYLGALLGKGLERDAIGDILLQEGEAYVALVPSVKEEVLSLDSVRTASFKAEEVPFSSCPIHMELEKKRITVASTRLDAMLSEVFSLSREQAKKAILSGLVHVGSSTILRPDYCLKENERVALRGKGKFLYLGEEGISKKGKSICEIALYR